MEYGDNRKVTGYNAGDGSVEGFLGRNKEWMTQLAIFILYPFYLYMFAIAKQRNLLHWFKKRSVSAENLNKYLKLKPDADRNIGSLPYDWIKAFDESERPKITRLVQDTFCSFSKETAGAKGKNLRYISPELFLQAHEKLAAALKNILKREDISVSYQGSGALKNCHRLDIGDFRMRCVVLEIKPQ